MLIEIGVGLLCVSQATMWWRNGVMWRSSVAGNVHAMTTLARIAESAEIAACNATSANDRAWVTKETAATIRDELRAGLVRKQRSDAGKPRKGRNGSAPEASADPIGPVST